jgi:cysteine desulfurase/selenocysteine lyase
MRLREQGVEVTVVGSDREGRVDPKDIDEAITDRTRLVSVNHVSNVFGSVRDVKKITQIAHRSDVLTLVDGSQSAGHMPVDIKDIGCDFFITPGHKGLLGPQGTGVLCIKDPDILEPVYVGGGTVHAVTTESYELEPSPSKFEAGTPNIPGVIGLGRAVEYVKDIGVEAIEKHEKELAQDTATRLAEIEGVEVYGPKDRTGVVPFNVQGMNPHDVAMILDETRNICVRSGYHCAMPSVDLIGVEGTVRASFALYNTKEEVDSLIKGVEQITMLA